MKLEFLFRRFDDLADTPERIPALRKVIFAYLLHSAVTSPVAISHAATLRAVHENRRRELIHNARRKIVSTVQCVLEEELPPTLSDIPAVLFDRLGNIASIEKGLSQIQSTKPGQYPLVVTAEKRSSSESYDFDGAAAIVPLVSSTGHGDASLKRLHYQEGRYAVGNILAVIKPICENLIRARFIYEYLTAFKDELLVSRMVGTANVSLTVNKLKEVPVPLVSGTVLSRIDELMALCDRLEAQQQEREAKHAALARASLVRFAEAPTPANLDFIFHKSYAIPPADLRKSILTLAVQGKLVPQDPNDEPAVELLKRIRSEKAQRVAQPELKRERYIPKTDNPTIPYDLPNGWCWSQLGDLSLTVTSGSRDWAAHYASEGAIFVRMGNLSRNSYRLRLDKIQRVAPPPNAEGERTRLEAGDILISITGEVGLLGMIPDDFGEAYINQHTCLVRLPRELRNRFIAEFFRSPFAQEHFNAPQRGLKNSFRLTDVTALPTPLPPLAEQRRIVAKVDQLMALVDQLEAQIDASHETGGKLLEAVVAELAAEQN